MRASMLSLAVLQTACATAPESPVTGTWTATDAIRDGAPALDVVFMSGFGAHHEQVSSALTRLGSQFLQKPFDAEQLMAMLRRAAARRFKS